MDPIFRQAVLDPEARTPGLALGNAFLHSVAETHAKGSAFQKILRSPPGGNIMNDEDQEPFPSDVVNGAENEDIPVSDLEGFPFLQA